MNKKVFIVLVMLLSLSHYGLGDSIESPLNHRTISDKLRSYKFIIIGHTYGSHNPSIYPSSSLLANLSNIDSVNPDFMVTLGDILNIANDKQIKALKESFINRVGYPVFNAVGNHDVTDRALYENLLGKTYYSFRINTELFIILDSEENPGQLSSQQVKYISTLLEDKANQSVKNVFVFSHRLLWSIENRPNVDDLPNKINGPKWYPELVEDFDKDVKQKLNRFSDAKVYLVSGDIGSPYFPAVFYHKGAGKFTYLSTRLDDVEGDMVIVVKVNFGKVTFEASSLGYEQSRRIETYGFEHWMNEFATRDANLQSASFTEMVARLLMDKKFWLGMLMMGLLCLLLAAVIKRRNKGN